MPFGATNYPGSLDDAASLGALVNNCATTLAASYTSGATSIAVTDGSAFPTTGGAIFVGGERTVYSARSGNTLTIAALSNNYLAGAAVELRYDAANHNVLRAAIVALEARVGVTGDSTAGTLTKRIADLESSAGSFTNNVSAAGSTTSDATVITGNSRVTTVSAGQGVRIDGAAITAGKTIIVANAGANALAVYPPTSANLNGLGTNVAMSLPVGGTVEIVCQTTTVFSTTSNVIASETFAGVVEIATAAEATTGIDDVRAITPKKLTEFAPATATVDTAADELLIRDATDGKLKRIPAGATASAQGLVEIATTAEADAGTDTARAVTPEGVKSHASKLHQNSQSAAYTLVLADAGKHILHPSADTSARTFTIPANASVAFPIGTAVTFINQSGAGVVTIAITTDTMRLAGAGTTGSRTLAANGIATAIKITATEWIISGTGLT